jgi:hypothetical protein
MLLRFRGPDGTVRLTVDPSDTFAQLGDKVWQHDDTPQVALLLTRSTTAPGGSTTKCKPEDHITLASPLRRRGQVHPRDFKVSNLSNWFKVKHTPLVLL